MSIAEVLYEQYKVLPPQVQEELLMLIQQGKNETVYNIEIIEKLTIQQNQSKQPITNFLEELDKEFEAVINKKGLSKKDIDKSLEEMNKNRTDFKRKLRAKNESSN